MYEKILELFPHIKNRIVTLSDEDLLSLVLTYGDDVVILDIDIPADAYSVRFGNGVLFRLRDDRFFTMLSSRIYEGTMAEVLGKFDSCLISTRTEAGPFSRMKEHSRFGAYRMSDDPEIFNDFWRLTPSERGYLKVSTRKEIDD